MQRKLIFCIGLIGICTCISGQVTDDFTDGDLVNDPQWLGETGKFKVSVSSAIPEPYRPGLQLDSEGTGSACLYLDAFMEEQMEWSFWTKLSFNTSGNNYLKVCLYTQDSPLTDSSDGIFLQLGGIDDSLFFLQQDGGIARILFCGSSVYTGNSTNALRLRVIYDSGRWEVFSGAGESYPVTCEGGFDLESQQGNFSFGLCCHHTASNASKFYFDNFHIGRYEKDTIPPEITEVTGMGPKMLKVRFSEPVRPETYAITENYRIREVDRNPDSIFAPGETLACLIFPEPLEEDRTYTLEYSGLEDASGNISPLSAFGFTFYSVSPYDVVINEILADPSPSAGLPEYEYLELYNVSANPVDLDGWGLRIGSSLKVFPEVTLQPGGLIIVCQDNAAQLYSAFGKTHGFESFSLPNEGQELVLTDKQGRVICHTKYSIDWFNDGAKAEGGWSLEQIDPWSPCQGEHNWAASVESIGGTPGRPNSIDQPNFVLPQIDKVCHLESNMIRLFFNQSMDSVSIGRTSLYRVAPAGVFPTGAYPVPPDFRSVRLQFAGDFLAGTLYEIELNDTLCVCNGQCAFVSGTAAYGVPGEPGFNDLVINEILFNPIGDGVDYLEIYNRSDKVLDLSNISIASIAYNPPAPPDTTRAKAASGCSPVVPGDYRLLTGNPDAVLDQYHSEDKTVFIRVSGFPSFRNDNGTVLLLDGQGTAMDILEYSDEMHFPMLISHEGVALEKINFDLPGHNRESWRSASFTSGYGTPGYLNSQYAEGSGQPEVLSLSPKVFSPDSDGIDDVLSISVKPENTETSCSITVFNMSGHSVRQIVNNQLVGTDEFFTWNGTDDKNRLLPPGNYIVVMRLYSRDGKIVAEKKPCGLVH